MKWKYWFAKKNKAFRDSKSLDEGNFERGMRIRIYSLGYRLLSSIMFA